MTQPASVERRNPGRLWRRRVRLAMAVLAVVAVIAVGLLIWSGPRADVPVPGSSATPAQLVRTYASAVNARDFATANAIDARTDSGFGRFSRPGRIDNLVVTEVLGDSDHAQVLFEADFSGGDGSLHGHDLWGYILERGDDGLWHIVDAGVN